MVVLKLITQIQLGVKTKYHSAKYVPVKSLFVKYVLPQMCYSSKHDKVYGRRHLDTLVYQLLSM